MFVLFGLRTSTNAVARGHARCPACGVIAHQRVVREVTKLTVFFIPTLTVRTRYTTTCAACGDTAGLSEPEAYLLAVASRR